MKEMRLIMGMPVSMRIIGAEDGAPIFERAFEYFQSVDHRFSTYKEYSEISQINRGEILPDKSSRDMREVFAIAERTKKETNGYFDIRGPHGLFDPSGVVKGWAIRNAARIIADAGFEDFFVEAGGDIEARGVNEQGEKWRVGIRNPFNLSEIVKVLHLGGLPRTESRGIATSGNYERGLHIYNPKTGEPAMEIASITVVGPDALEADRFATAAFAMGEQGIEFIEKISGLEAYQINKDGVATMTSGFQRCVDK